MQETIVDGARAFSRAPSTVRVICRLAATAGRASPPTAAAISSVFSIYFLAFSDSMIGSTLGSARSVRRVKRQP